MGEVLDGPWAAAAVAVLLAAAGCSSPALLGIARDALEDGLRDVSVAVERADRVGLLGEHELGPGALKAWAEDPVREDTLDLAFGVFTDPLSLSAAPSREELLLRVVAVARDTTFSEGRAQASGCLRLVLDLRGDRPALTSRPEACAEAPEERGD